FQLLCPSIPTLFSTFLLAFFDFTILYPPCHFLYFFHAIFIRRSPSSSPFSFLFSFIPSLCRTSIHLFYSSSTPLSHTPSLCFNPFSLLLSIFSLFTLSLQSIFLSIPLTLLSLTLHLS